MEILPALEASATMIGLGFAYRARGGAISLGEHQTTFARVLFWGIPCGVVMTLIAHAHGLPLWYGAVGAVAAWAGACIGHASEQGPTISQNIGMSTITALMLAIMTFPFYVVGENYFYLVLPLGFLGGLAYYLGFRIPVSLIILGKTWCVPRSTEWGEFLTGILAFGLPLGLAIII